MYTDKYINFDDNYTSLNFPRFGERDVPHISSADYALRKGKKNALKYGE